MTAAHGGWEPDAVRRLTVHRRCRQGGYVGLAILSMALIYSGPDGISTAGWLVVGSLLAITGAVTWLATGTRWGQSQFLPGQQIEFALRTHVDPGPGYRGKADVRARRDRNWPWNIVFVLPAVTAVATTSAWTATGETVLGFLSYLVLMVFGARETYGRGRAARRWWQDPPGPPRWWQELS